MNVNINEHFDELLFVPLGGTDRIGMNFYAYHYNGKWLIVDMGLGFAENDTPGVEILLPLPTFMEQHKDDIVALILTHVHEDHIGAVPYLWDRIGCPIYATPITKSILQAKFIEFEVPGEEIKITEMHEGDELQLSPFSVELIGITHSVPEAQTVLIKTARGNILHTGDWKMDDNPILGKTTNIERFKRVGDDGLLALVCDSTNIFVEDRSRSEGELRQSLADVIQTSCNKDGLIVITTFASNLARLCSIIQAAQTAGRKIVLSGRSLWRFYNIARDLGYIAETIECMQAEEISNFKRSEVLVICTGCQGELLAASTKIANNTHPTIKMVPGDTIIFSSRIIPGNERRIFNLFNSFCKIGVEVITERDHFVHVSGHPSKSEVAELYQLVRPSIVIPVHGEPMHLHEHYKFAMANGIQHCIKVDVGDVLSLSQDGVKKIGTIETGVLVVDGSIIVDANSPIICERKMIGDNGAIVVLLLINQRGKLIRQPKIFSPGILDYREDRELLDMLIEEVRDLLPTVGEQNFRATEKSVKKVLGTRIKKLMRQFRKKDPYVLIHIEQVTI